MRRGWRSWAGGATGVLLLAAPLLAAAWSPLVLGNVERENVHVSYVVDGDTFKDEAGHSYRLVGINAPEIAHPDRGKPAGEPGGPEAMEALRNLIGDKDVQIVRGGAADHYGRSVVLVFEQSLGDEPVNAWMVKAGHARVQYLKLAPGWFDTVAFTALCQGGQANAPATEGGRGGPLSQDSSIVMKPGDKVFLVVGQQDQTFVISTAGSIYVKGLGELRLAGLGVREARDSLAAMLKAKGVRAECDVYFVPVIPPPPKVSLLGDVLRPGFYQAQTLLELLTTAGVNGSLVGEAIVRDTQATLAQLNVKAVMLGEVADVPLPPGAIVFISSRTQPKWINVYGEVPKPGPVQTISALGAIGGAFGLKENAARNRIQIHLPDGTTQIFDYERVAAGEATDLALPEGAVVYVPAKGTVGLSGAIARPGWVYADSAREALKNAGWPTEKALVKRALFKSVEGETRLVDLTAVLAGNPQADFPLKTGDELFLPEEPRPAVEVAGWVEREGIYRETTVFECVLAAGPKAGATTTITVFDLGRADTAGETIPLMDLRQPARSNLRVRVDRLPFIQISGAVTTPGIYYVTTLPELISKAFGLTPEAELSSLAFYDTYGRLTPLPADGQFPCDGLVRVPAKPAPVPGDLIPQIDSNVLVTGYGIKTCVLPPSDLRQLLLRAGFQPGKSGLNVRVYRIDRNPRLTFKDRRGKFVLNRNMDQILVGRQVFLCEAGDAVFLEDKNDPIGWMTRIVSFLRTMSGASTTIINTGGGQ